MIPLKRKFSAKASEKKSKYTFLVLWEAFITTAPNYLHIKTSVTDVFLLLARSCQHFECRMTRRIDLFMAI